MGEWESLSLREAGVRLIDCDHRTPEGQLEGYPYVAIPQMRDGRIDPTTARRISHRDFIDWTRKAMPRDHDVVLSRRTNPGVTAVAPIGLEYALGQNLVLLRSDGSRVHPPFLRWLVKGPSWWEQIDRFLNVGAVFDSLRCADVPNFLLRVPPLDEQRRIAGILGGLDDRIESNRALGLTQRTIARTVFASWLREQRRAGAPVGPISALADVNPESWTARDRPELVRYVDLGATGADRIDGVVILHGGAVPSRAQRVLRPGDTIVGTIRPGNRAYALIQQDGLTGSTGFAQLRPRNIRDVALVYLAATAEENIARLARLADGGAYPAVRPAVVAQAEIPIASISALEWLSRHAQPLLDRAAVADAEAATLASIRDLLLPRLLDDTVGAGPLLAV